MTSQFYKLDADLCRRRDLTPGDKVVLAIIADRVRGNGHSWPGIRSLSDDAALNRSTVERSIVRLEKCGLIRVEHGRGRRSNSYIVLLSNVRKKQTLRDTGKVRQCPHFAPSVSAKSGICVRKKRTETERTIEAEKQAPAKIVFDPAAVTFTGISPDDLSRWQSAYPALDVKSEIKKAAEWLATNPTRRKKDNRRFLVGWLARGQKWAAERTGCGSAGGPVFTPRNPTPEELRIAFGETAS